MLKSLKFVSALLIASAALAASGGAMAADFVTNSTGTAIYGTADVLVIYKDTSAGYNRAAVKYPSGYQFVADDGAWTVYAKLVSKLGTNGVAVPGAADGKVVNIAHAGGVVCQNNNTLIAFNGVAALETIADHCATFNAAKAASQ